VRAPAGQSGRLYFSHQIQFEHLYAAQLRKLTAGAMENRCAAIVVFG
jgi:hypothetical protein